MKKFFVFASAAIVLLSSSLPAKAQIPVTDAASIASQAAHYIDVIAQWQQQYRNMINQITTMQSQLQAVTGIRDMGKLFTNPVLYQQLPPDMQAVYQDVRRSGNTLNGMTAKNNGDRSYYGTINTSIDQLKSGYQASVDRLGTLQGLLSQVDATQDQKASQDLANRISTEQALLQNENAKIALMAQLQTMQMKIAEEQRSREYRQKYMGGSQ